MKRPSFQMYPGDWLSNQKLRRCTFTLRGIWIDAICLMCDSDEYGVLRFPLQELASAVGCQVKMLKELREKGVLKGADVGEKCAALIYTPRHGGKLGDPVTLIPEQDGPIWYSSRMVRDEYVRTLRGTYGEAGEKPKAPTGDNLSHVRTRAPARSASSSTSEESTTSAEASAEDRGAAADGAPPCPHEKMIELFHEVLTEHPKVLEWGPDRQACMRQRWREKAKPNGVSQGYKTVEDGLKYWRRFFEHVKKSRFLTGQADGTGGRAPFIATLEWLMRPKNFAKVVEGNYHREVDDRGGARG